MGAAWWVFRVFASVLVGAAVVGAVGLVLGLLSDGLGASQALQIGALVGAAFGVTAAFGSGATGWTWGAERASLLQAKGEGRAVARELRAEKVLGSSGVGASMVPPP